MSRGVLGSVGRIVGPARIALAFALLAASLLSSACVPEAIESADERPEEITVVAGVSGRTLNPYSPVLANRQVGELIFRGLTDVTEAGAPAPDLLRELPTTENGGLSADGTSVTLELARDAVWHDGKPVTATDVAFTLGLLREGVFDDEPTRDYGNVREVKVIDARRLRIELREPDAPFVWTMVPFVLPAHILAEEPRPATVTPYWFEPVGSGPYRVSSVVPGNVLALEPTDAASVPLRIVFVDNAEDARAVYDAAASAVWLDGPSEAGGAGETLVTTAGTTWRAWIFDVSRGSIAADPFVRRTFMSLVPHESTSSVPPTDPFGLPLEPRTLESTRVVSARLQAEGWRRDADGPATKDGDGFDILAATRTLLSEELPRFEALTAATNSIGITFRTFTLDFLDVGGYYERDYLTNGEWDVARSRFYASSPLIGGWPFHSGDEPGWDDPYGTNVFGVDDSELDRRYAAVIEAGTPDEMAEAWSAVGERLREMDVLYWEYPEPNNMLVKGVESVAAHAFRTHLLRRAPEWRLAQSGGE